MCELSPNFKSPFKGINIKSFPRHKLKIVGNNQNLPEESAEIEHILGHKVNENNFHYLVKWKDFPVKEATWIPETYFNSMDLINKYKESLKDKVQLRKRGTKKINSLTLFKFLILSTLIIPIISGATIKRIVRTTKANNSTKSTTVSVEPFNVLRENFRGCTGETDKNLINLNNLCKYEPDGSKRIVKNYLINQKMALKDREETKITMHILEKNVDGNYCSYSCNPLPEFSWWSEVTTIFYSCTISPKLIAAKNNSDNLFNTKCKAKDKFCSIHDSIIVWDDTSYHSCPMYEISTEVLFHLNARNPDVLVALPNMAFQAIKTEKICALNTLNTSEGIYLSLTKNKDVSKHPKNGADINEIKEILLADLDFVSRTEAVEVNFLMHQECLKLKSTLKLATLRDKEFMKFNMPNGKNITIYSYMRTLYGATCKPIEKIEISLTNSVSNDSNELCFRDQPVTYTIDKEIKKGFLINDGIIKPNSE
ncbi:unnamed protein product, partial [Brachionus calyciflorus]